MTSSASATLPIPQLPPAATTGYIIPGLNKSLISVTKLCAAGCTVLFREDECVVKFKGNEVLRGKKHDKNGLWYIPLLSTNQGANFVIQRDDKYFAGGIHQSTSMEETIKFLHQCLFSPTVDTMCKAIDNGQLVGFPHITSKLVKKYLPLSTATAKGHLNRTRKGLRSTTKGIKTKTESGATDFNPKQEDIEEVQLFIGATIGEQNTGTVYTDQTGNFPVRSFQGNKCQFVAYDYRSNAILVRPLKDQTDKSLLEAFEDVYEYLTTRGFKPRLNVMDNQCSKTIQKFIESSKAKIQLVNPDDHRVNAAERAIQTWKNHWLAGMGTLDPNCPIQLWCQFIEQGQDTLNMLRTSRVNPCLSAYAILDGQFEFDRTPLAPVGTKALVFLDPKKRTTWQSHAIDAWYVGPAKKHYRCYKFFIPETKGYRIANTAKFYPAHCKTPTIEPGDTIRLAAQDLIAAIEQNNNLAPISLHHKHTEALRNLAAIFADTIKEPEQALPRVETAVPRVHSTPTTSSEPTAPRHLKQMKFVHQRVTRSNKPPPAMPTIHEESQQSLGRARRREKRTQPVAPPPIRKKRTVREYQQAREMVKEATPRPVDKPLPNFISQDEDEANLSFRMRTNVGMQASANPCGIKAEAVYHLMGQHIDNTTNCFVPEKLQGQQATFEDNILSDHMANGVVHPITQETITKYEKLAKDPLMKDTWTKAMAKELGRLAQGFESTKGTETVFFMSHDEIKRIPKDRTVTYARIVVDYRPQKEDPNRVRITVGGNLIEYPGELTTRTADLTTAKILWNSTLSTPGAKFSAVDVGNFYLATPLDRFEYMKIKAELVPEEFKKQYKLHDKIYKGFLYMEIRRGCYGLPQSGILANKLLKTRMAKHGYFEVTHTPGLWKHVSRPIQFTLVVDDFGIKYVGDEHFEHLINALKEHYDVTIDKEGTLYCGITLEWDYSRRTLDISMPGYVKKQLVKYNHPTPKSPQHCPWSPQPIHYGSKTQEPIPPDKSPQLDKDGVKLIQQVVGSFLYYCRATDTTIPEALSELSQQQTKATKNTLQRCRQFLDYMATHPDAKIRYYASDMILNVHSDASYLSVPNARSRAAGIFFLGSRPQADKPILLNGIIHVLCTILRFVAASAAEAELGALFLNAKEAKVMRLTLEELGHPQPPTPIHVDNSTTVGIVNNTIKRQKSRSMEMRYFWLLDGKVQKLFSFQYHPGFENLADYPSKSHPGTHHQAVRNFYLHMPNSPRILERAAKPSKRRGCVDQGKPTYYSRHLIPDLLRLPSVVVRSAWAPAAAA